MNTRRTTLIVALVLAVGTGWLTLRYLGSLQQTANANSRPVSVLVAAQEIPARIPITLDMLARTTRPASTLEPDALLDPAKVVGSISLITIPAGATITQSKIGSSTMAALPVRLTPGMRAVSISIDKVKGISGLIQPGDRVDVIAVPPKTATIPQPASAILRGIRVLSVGADLEAVSATPSPQEQLSTTITLEVTPKQADLLAMADLNTTLRLSLRSPREPLNSYPAEALHFGPEDAGVQAGGGAPQNPVDALLALKALGQQQQAPSVQVRRPAAAPSGVTIIDGDHYISGESGKP